MFKYMSKIFHIFAIVVIVITMLPRAAAPYANAQFLDVPADAPYAEAALYMRQKNWITGIGHNLLLPDAPCTVKTMAIVLGRALYDQDDPDVIIELAQRHHWLDSDDKEYLNKTLTHQEMYDMLSRATEGIVEADVASTAEAVDLKDETDVIVSRADMISAIYDMLGNKETLYVSSFYSDMNISLEQDFDRQIYTKSIQLASFIPDEVWKAFDDNGGTIVVGDDYIDNYNRMNNSNTVGLFTVNRNIIRISKAESLTHEMGHFVYYTWDLIDEVTAAYEKEKDVASEILRPYAASAPHELFADFFRAYLTGTEEERETLRTNLPATYKILAELIRTNWALPLNQTAAAAA